MEKKEFKVGEEFQFGDVRLKCVKGKEKICVGCYFRHYNYCLNFSEVLGFCSGSMRLDKTDVIFVEVE